ncbi:MAG: hypothetical protein LBG27_13435 [Spirochaetaceae bacterium]|jgi:hypothetical protein|nr:hypothetical protein [Spirochaetaceae bacterium]
MKRQTIAVVLVLLGARFVFGDENVAVSIRFYDKQIYHLASEPILVQVTITNNGLLPYRFRLAEDRAFSVEFDVKTLQNRMVPQADALLRKRTGSRQVYFRDVAVETGESFSFIEDLRHYAAIEDAGAYVIQAKIYPEAYRASLDGAPDGTPAVLSSNRLQLTVRPPAIPGPDGLPVMLDVETKANLVREKLPPDEVVAWTINARQRSQWEKFFLYIDLETMVSRDGSRQRQWRTESEEGRARMVARYRSDLMAATVDGDISMIPSDFTIERTAYNAENAEVTVQCLFRQNNFTERRRYTYYLRRDSSFWSIVDYMVINLGTE